MNITPKNIFKSTNSDGTSFRIAEWDYATLANIESFGFIAVFVTAFVICSFASPILLIICILTIDGRIKLANILGLLIGSYFLIDAYYNWLGMATLGLICDKPQLSFIISLNVASLFLHVLFLLFNGMICEKITNDDAVKNAAPVTYLIVVSGIFLFSFFTFGKSLTPIIGKQRFDLIKSWEENAANHVDWHEECKNDNWHNE